MKYKKDSQGKCIIVSLICYIVVASYITTNKATMEVVYTEEGCVEIYNKSGDSYGGLDIQICTEDDKTIYTEHVEKKNLLFAREEEYISSKIDGGKNVQRVLLGSQLLHWTYRLNLRQEVEKNGCYYIKIIVYQEGKSVELINSFTLKEDEFMYAKEHIIKDY